jgi:hypothetical protein
MTAHRRHLGRVAVVGRLKAMPKTYVQAFPEASWRKAMSQFPAQKPARLELVPYIPVAGESDFYGMPVDSAAMGSLLPEWMTSGINARPDYACIFIQTT